MSRDRWSSLDSSRRVGWARYYSEAEYARQLERLCEVCIDRVDVILPELLGLVRSVLYDRNVEAFSRAYRVQSLIDSYERGRRR